MNIYAVRKLHFFGLFAAMVLVLGAVSISVAQVTTTQTASAASRVSPVPSGAKLKFRGVVIDRQGDSFTIRDRTRTDYQVLITDRTSVKTYGGFFSGGKKYPVTDILRGLIVEVEGRGDSQGQLVADKIRFRESDMRAALTTDTRVGPVEENQQKIAGQIDELYAVAQEARQEVARVDERVSALDDYDETATVAVTFRVNSAVLSPEAKQQLDDFATKAVAGKGYMIEVAGHTDATGSASANQALSERRAETVRAYLTGHGVNSSGVTAIGFGSTRPLVEETNTDGSPSTAGRAFNRRVELAIRLP